MLGSTHGTLTTDSRRTRAIACGEQRPGPAVHGRVDDLDVGGRPLHATGRVHALGTAATPTAPLLCHQGRFTRLGL